MDTQGQGINSNHNGGTYIVNTVLSFVRHGMNVGTETNTIKVANSTFSLGEIKDASVVFWEKCSPGNPPVRQTSVHRTQAEAMLTDIVDMMRKLESEDKMPILYVDVLGLAYFPKFNVEEINEVAIVERLRRLENKMFSMSNMVNENCDEIGSIKQHVASTQHDLRTHCDVHKLRNNHDVRDEGAVSGGGVVPDSNPTGIRTTDGTTDNGGSGSAQHGDDGNFQPGNGGNAQPDCSNVQHGNGGNAQPRDASTSAQRGNGGNAQPGDASTSAQPGNGGNAQPGDASTSAQRGNGGNAQPGDASTNAQPGNGGNAQPGDASTSAQRGNGGNAQPGDASTNAQPGKGGNAQPGGGVTPPSNDNKDESTSIVGSGAQSGYTAGDGGAIPKGCVSQHGGARRQVGSVKFNNRSNFDEPEGTATTMAAIVQALSDTHDKWKKAGPKSGPRNYHVNSKSISGKSSNSRIKAGPEPNCEVHIDGIDNESHTPDDLRSFLELCDIRVKKLVRLSMEQRSRASYLLVVPVSDEIKVYDDELWPSGINVRPFTRH